MQPAAQLRRYKQVQVMTSSPGQILIALHEAAIQYAREGAESIRQRDVVGKGTQLQRVSDIVAELMSTLDHSVSPEICKNLERLYTYMQERLAQANALLQPEPAEEVAQLLATLLDGWQQVVKQVENAR